jgi:hypothetical protein
MKEMPTKKNAEPELEDDLQPEYDLRSLLKGGVQGKYVERYKSGTNLVLLAPDVAEVFPSTESVNEALRLVILLNRVSDPKKHAKAARR